MRFSLIVAAAALASALAAMAAARFPAGSSHGVRPGAAGVGDGPAAARSPA